MHDHHTAAALSADRRCQYLLNGSAARLAKHARNPRRSPGRSRHASSAATALSVTWAKSV